MYLYKKWSFIILLNNLIVTNFLSLQKKILFLQFDLYKYFFYTFSKAAKTRNTRIIFLKSKI